MSTKIETGFWNGTYVHPQNQCTTADPPVESKGVDFWKGEELHGHEDMLNDDPEPDKRCCLFCQMR